MEAILEGLLGNQMIIIVKVADACSEGKRYQRMFVVQFLNRCKLTSYYVQDIHNIQRPRVMN